MIPANLPLVSEGLNADLDAIPLPGRVQPTRGKRIKIYAAEHPVYLAGDCGIRLLSEFVANGIKVNYLHDTESGAVGLVIYPDGAVPLLMEHRTSHLKRRAWAVDSLVQLKCAGDPYPLLFCQGRTLRNSASTAGLRFVEQFVERDGDETAVVTVLESEKKYRCTHRLAWRAGEPLFECSTTFVNLADTPVTLEMLTSFSLGGMTPFAADAATGQLNLHRLRSAWCAEGRLESQPLEDLQLESFQYQGVPASERFGQVGSMPVRGWFPFAGIEHRESGICWGAQIAWAGSWQMEVYRLDDMVNLSGGLADREFGHWTKEVNPGESFCTPLALITTSANGLDAVCSNLLAWQERTPLLSQEESLPVAFNEWCSSWGFPDHSNLIRLADRLKDTGVRYLIIDGGWYQEHGLWQESKTAFPYGLANTASEIRRRGLIPGLWFEIETCMAGIVPPFGLGGFLRRDGIPIVSTRRFWDFLDPEVIEFLSERIIDKLENCGFGYVKIDYNDTIGIGCDGAESLGEGLRLQIEAVQHFWKRLRERLPDIVIENCSSGGHRLEPSMLALSDVASSSDAHELQSIPIIAANLHRAVLPRKSQVWAVLRKTDDKRRQIYSLTAAMLGRMLLSGDINELSDDCWQLVLRGLAFYNKLVPILKNGTSRKSGPPISSYNQPEQWQGLLRWNETLAMAIIHTFGLPNPPSIQINLPAGDWKIIDTFHSLASEPEIRGDQLVCIPDGPWSGSAILMERADKCVAAAGSQAGLRDPVVIPIRKHTRQSS